MDKNKKELIDAIKHQEKALKSYRGYVSRLKSGKKVGYLSLENARNGVIGLKASITKQKKMLKNW